MIQDRTCQTCGTVFQGGPRAYYCPVCRAERAKRSTALSRARKSEGKNRVGKTDLCERCGARYEVYVGLQRFCQSCQKVHAKEYDRKTSLEFYREHRDMLNPVRMIRRRKAAIACVICGKEFKAPTSILTCSEECRRKRRNLMHKTIYGPRYERKRKKRAH